MTFVLPAVEASAQASAPASKSSRSLSDVIITGNPLRQADVIGPVESLSGDALALRRGSTLGDTLDGLPGVSSSYFGPNANRPVLRGLDGDRVRMLSNAGSTLDASSLSFDHAVPIDPLVVERIEVLRGPSSLLYGGSAIGGVVNSIDNRIPRRPAHELGGRVELRGATGAQERSGAVVLDGGAEAAPGSNAAWHADAFGRQTGDLRVPTFTPVVDGVALAVTDRLRNSASRSSGGAVGGSLHSAQGFIGVSADSYRSTYGVVVEPDVSVQMQRDGLHAAGEWRAPVDGLQTARFELGHIRYQHQEVDATGAVGTTFKNLGTSLRLELAHAAWAGWRGMGGAQLESSTFSALGDEAFVPTTHTRQQAVFMVEERAVGDAAGKAGSGRVSVGLRAEAVQVGSDGDADLTAVPRFGAAQSRRFGLMGASVGGLWRLDEGWQTQATLSHSERAPTYYELYANGVHVATAAYERGDSALARERGQNLDLALAWKGAHATFKAGLWQSRFANYIVLAGTGQTVTSTSATGASITLPLYAFRGVSARLSGLELSGQQAWTLPLGELTLDAKLDAVQGTDLDRQQPLPRLAPWRSKVGLALAAGVWTARAELDHAARQTRVPTDDVPTPAYTLLNLAATWRLERSLGDALLYAKLNNVGNTLAYNAASIRTVRDVAPMPGRSLAVGVHASF